MKALSRRLARLEGPVAAPLPADELDWSKVDVADQEWATALLADLPEADGQHDFSGVSVEDLRLLEWIMARCTPSEGIDHHEPECQCYFCQPFTTDRGLKGYSILPNAQTRRR